MRISCGARPKSRAYTRPWPASCTASSARKSALARCLSRFSSSATGNSRRASRKRATRRGPPGVTSPGSSISHTGSLPCAPCSSAHSAALTSVALRIAWIDENSGRVPCAGNTALA
ncbi:hypothetical protein D3C72_1598770 [compost metagenome]